MPDLARWCCPSAQQLFQRLALLLRQFNAILFHGAFLAGLWF